MECFYCQKDIEIASKKFMLAIERPYKNLWFHKDCYTLIKSEEIIYLYANIERILEYNNKKKK